MHTPVSTRRSGCEGHQPGPGSPFPHPRGPHAQHLPRSASVGKGKNRLSPENEVRWRVSRPESSPPGRPAAWAPKAGSPPGSLHRPLGRAGPHPIRGLQRGRGEAFPMYVGATWPFPGGRDGRTQRGRGQPDGRGVLSRAERSWGPACTDRGESTSPQPRTSRGDRQVAGVWPQAPQEPVSQSPCPRPHHRPLHWLACRPPVPSAWRTGRPGKGANPGERGPWKVTRAAPGRVPITAQVHE